VSGGCPEGSDCGKIRDLLNEILDEELAADVYDDVARHLHDCPDCTLHVDSVKKVIRLYREAGKREPPVDIKIDLEDVLARVRSEEDSTDH
jgi:predicted anti-sigma-YlaC factor YlaD